MVGLNGCGGAIWLGAESVRTCTGLPLAEGAKLVVAIAKANTKASSENLSRNPRMYPDLSIDIRLPVAMNKLN